LLIGVAVWMAYGAYVFATSPASPWEKLGTGAIAIGILMLLASVIWERLREWETDPYRDVHR
ncbi:MAG: anti-sigma factor, partial [Gemmatimonadetes bacterium]|nr:anti-sigma factor [Gemmatimonadota bacterium]